MKISKKLYVDEDVSYHKWVIWKLRKDKKIENIYCIIYRENYFLEIINSNKIKDNNKVKDQYSQSTLIGISTTKQKALELVARIFHEVYVPNPNIQDMKDYFIENL